MTNVHRAALCAALAVWMFLVAAAAPQADAQACFGDCDGDGGLTLGELQTAVAISLGELPSSSCVAIDGDGNGVVVVSEVERGVAEEVLGCGQSAPTSGVAAASGIGIPIVHLGSTSGLPGQTASFDVTLETSGEPIAGVQVDIAFDPNTPIAAKVNGRPDCIPNAAINKGGTSFAFQPPGCSGSSCTAIRSLVLALDNVDPIPDGSVMFSCNVAIAPSAPNGVYPLVGSNAGSSDPQGSAISTDVTNGAVTVGNVPPTTASPTVTPSAGGAPGSLILRRARLRADTSRRPRHHNGWIRLDGVVNANPPLGNLADEMVAAGMQAAISTTAGARIELPWKPIACVQRDSARGPLTTCTAEDVLGWRQIVLRPSGIPNLLEMHLVARDLDFIPPLTAEPVRVALRTTAFERLDDLGGCVVRGSDAKLKKCHEEGVLPTATATVTDTATLTSTATPTQTPPPTRTITRTRTATNTHPPTSTPTETRTPTQVVVPSVALGERVFTIEPGVPFADPSATGSGLFTSLLPGSNIAQTVSSGPLVLVGGLPDASGVASLVLQQDVTLLLTLIDGSYACLKLFAAGSSGSIDCDGGTAYDVIATQAAGDVGFMFAIQTHAGAPAPPGHGDLVLTVQGQFVPAGPVPDCDTITYDNPPQQFAYTTANATAVKGAIQLTLPGEPFSCNEFATSGTGGMLAAPAPVTFEEYGDLANVFRFAE